MKFSTAMHIGSAKLTGCLKFEILKTLLVGWQEGHLACKN